MGEQQKGTEGYCSTRQESRCGSGPWAPQKKCRKNLFKAAALGGELRGSHAGSRIRAWFQVRPSHCPVWVGSRESDICIPLQMSPNSLPTPL